LTLEVTGAHFAGPQKVILEGESVTRQNKKKKKTRIQTSQKGLAGTKKEPTVNTKSETENKSRK